jgi:hypothetical protein
MPVVDLSQTENLYPRIASGVIWSAPGWAIKMAVDAINSGKVPMPANIPEEYMPYITAKGAPSDILPVEPAGSAGAPTTPTTPEVPLDTAPSS